MNLIIYELEAPTSLDYLISKFVLLLIKKRIINLLHISNKSNINKKVSIVQGCPTHTVIFYV